MKAKFTTADKKIIQGTISFYKEIFYFFNKNDEIIIKLERARVEFLSKLGIMFNGFEKFDSEKENYIYRRYYFEIQGEMVNK